jgi:hypothetical protein
MFSFYFCLTLPSVHRPQIKMMVPNMAGGHTNIRNTSWLECDDCNKPDSTIDADSIKMLPAIVFMSSLFLSF